MLRRALATGLLITILVGSHAQEARPWAAPLRPILEILDNAKLKGSLALSHGCRQTSIPEFPRTNTNAGTATTPLRRLREVVEDPAIQIVQAPDGTIRMIEQGVQSDLLNVRISHISFENNGIALQYAYSANRTLLDAVLAAPEIRAFMKTHGLELPTGEGATGNSGKWPPSSPHISGAMDDLTLSEALDRVLTTFPGLWVYWNCSQSDHPTHVYFRFFGLEKIGDKEFIVGG
jgi:hypothetical protein